MIDWARVAELRDEVGEDDFGEVIEIFCEEVLDVLDRLDSRNVDEMKTDLHFLKGSAANIGMQKLSQICEDAERVILANGLSEVDLTVLRTTYEESHQAMRARSTAD